MINRTIFSEIAAERTTVSTTIPLDRLKWDCSENEARHFRENIWPRHEIRLKLNGTPRDISQPVVDSTRRQWKRNWRTHKTVGGPDDAFDVYVIRGTDLARLPVPARPLDDFEEEVGRLDALAVDGFAEQVARSEAQLDPECERLS